jgi:malonyl-CoA/methylmalonyl-CoA synthetase
VSERAESPRDLYGLFRSGFARHLERVVIECEDGRRYDYADLDAASARYAWLLRDMGVAHGDRVAVQVEKSPEAVFLYLGVLRLGAVHVPLNPAYTSAELGYFLGDAEPRVIVCRPEDETLLRQLGGSPTSILTLGTDADGSLAERCAALPGEFPPALVAPGDLAAILYTSGTTGRSKGAMLTHGNLTANGRTLRDFWAFVADDVLLHALPIFHAHGLFVALHCTLLAGARMLFLPRFDADAVVRLLPRATVMMGVPTFYTRLLANPGLTREACAPIRLFISGSAPLLAETHHRFHEHTGHAILERYGMTETAMNCSNPLLGERVPGSVGPPLPGVEVRVADAEGNVLETGETGVLEVRGPNVFPGYWRMPEKTRAEFRSDGFFVTGDVARIDERGYVHLVGRAQDLIISGGLNVYPKEVEEVLDRVEGVAESAVFGVPHPDFGEVAIAVVRRSADLPDLAEDAIVAAARRRLAAYKTPKRVFFIDELPRNAMGKVQKNVLQERYRALFD